MNETSKEKVKVAVTITAGSRRMKKPVPRWLEWIETELQGQCPDNINIKKCVVCAPHALTDDQENWLNNNENVGCSSKRYWCKIKHSFRGAGDTWREACQFSFEACQCGQPNIDVDYVLHTPIDIDYCTPYQIGSRYTPDKIRKQVFRTADQISNYWLRLQGLTGTTPLSPANKQKVLKGIAIADQQLRRIFKQRFKGLILLNELDSYFDV